MSSFKEYNLVIYYPWGNVQDGPGYIICEIT